MGVRYLWDTNTVIYYLQQQFPPFAEQLIDNLLQESLPCISAITEIELLCWKAASVKDEEILHRFIQDVQVIEIEPAIKLATANIRKQYKIKLPDAIIAATAIVYGYTLVTRNVEDFNKIDGLVIINPYQ
jgi:hypothetical protein